MIKRFEDLAGVYAKDFRAITAAVQAANPDLV